MQRNNNQPEDMDGMSDAEIVYDERKNKFIDAVTELDKKRSKSAKRAQSFNDIAALCREKYSEDFIEKHKGILLKEIVKTLTVSTQDIERWNAIKVAGHLITYDNILFKQDFEAYTVKLKQIIEERIQQMDETWVKFTIAQYALYSLYHETHHEIHHRVIPFFQKWLIKLLKNSSNEGKHLATICFTSMVHLVASFPTPSYKITWFHKLYEKLIQVTDDDVQANQVNTEFKLMVGEFFALCYEALNAQLEENNLTWDEVIEEDWEDMIPLVEHYEDIHTLIKKFTGYIAGKYAKDDKRKLRSSFRTYADAITYYRSPNELVPPEPQRITIAKQEVELTTVRQRLIYDLMTRALGDVQHLFFGSKTFCILLGMDDVLDTWSMVNVKGHKNHGRREWSTQRSQSHKLDTLDKKKATRSKIQFLAGQ